MRVWSWRVEAERAPRSVARAGARARRRARTGARGAEIGARSSRLAHARPRSCRRGRGGGRGRARRRRAPDARCDEPRVVVESPSATSGRRTCSTSGAPCGHGYVNSWTRATSVPPTVPWCETRLRGRAGRRRSRAGDVPDAGEADDPRAGGRSRDRHRRAARRRRASCTRAGSRGAAPAGRRAVCDRRARGLGGRARRTVAEPVGHDDRQPVLPSCDRPAVAARPSPAAWATLTPPTRARGRPGSPVDADPASDARCRAPDASRGRSASTGARSRRGRCPRLPAVEKPSRSASRAGSRCPGRGRARASRSRRGRSASARRRSSPPPPCLTRFVAASVDDDAGLAARRSPSRPTFRASDVAARRASPIWLA